MQETFGTENQIDSRYRSALFSTLKVKVGEKPGSVSVRAPRVTLDKIERGSGNQATLSVTVVDDNPQVITVFQDEDKVDLRMIGDTRNFAFPISLKPGANNLRVVVTDRDEVDQVLPIRLWGEGKPVEKKTAVSAPPPTKDVP